jgi:hypothetical protein
MQVALNSIPVFTGGVTSRHSNAYLTGYKKKSGGGPLFGDARISMLPCHSSMERMRWQGWGKLFFYKNARFPHGHFHALMVNGLL